MTAIEHFGPCCACERENATILYCLPFEAPEGQNGWGCVLCDLPPRGAIAVLCEACAIADATPLFVTAGSDITEHKRIAIDELAQTPFNHDEGKHRVDAEEMTRLAIAMQRASEAELAYTSLLQNGNGKYDDLCTYVREQAQASAAFVIVVGGNKGSGFSVQTSLPIEMLLRLPDLLEDLAKRVRLDVQRLKN